MNSSAEGTDESSVMVELLSSVYVVSSSAIGSIGMSRVGSWDFGLVSWLVFPASWVEVVDEFMMSDTVA